MTKILIIEDDPTVREALAYNLRREDFTPITAEDASAGIAMARQHRPDLVILDLMLPGGNGFDACKEIRSFSKAPIIILTARDEDVDRVLGLEMGADDYVTKPFSLRELLARIRANLRRVALDLEHGEDLVLQYWPLLLDVAARRAELHGQRVSLQPKEFDLLVYLIRHEGVVLTRDRILTAVWGHDFVGERTVDVHVRRLRAKLEPGGAENLIRTVHGVGYAFGTEKSVASAVHVGELSS